MMTVMLPVLDSLSAVKKLNGSKEILTLNPELLTLVARSEDWERLQQFDVCTIDSMPMAKILGAKGLKAGRYAGIELVQDLLCSDGQESSFLLFGGKPEVAERVAKQFNIRSARCYDGYKYTAEQVVQECIAVNFKPDIIFVGLGGLYQFQATKTIKEHLNPKVIVACGGAFDVLCGDLPRAPLWMQRAGLEWLFRTLKQPSRVFRLRNSLIGLNTAARKIRVIGDKSIQI